MTRRPINIRTRKEADGIMDSLSGWLPGVGIPNRQVRLLFACAAFYRAELHQVEHGEVREQNWAKKVAK